MRNRSTGLLIFPYNGNGLEAVDALDPGIDFIGFVDDTPAKRGVDRYGHAVLTRAAFDANPQALVLAVHGSSISYLRRREIIEGLEVDPARWARVIHPSASVSPRATLGSNVLVMAGVVISGNVVIGDHVCILPNSVIHHDAHIGDWCLVGSNVTIAGHALIGANAYVGSGASIMNGIRIGAQALIGLGACVIGDVPPARTAVGNPHRLL
jgi:sugar O-acyltransferase (sialic acid O-acetyltransferase NeuD family)